MPKCILLIENLLKKPCSAENSNHYQHAFWHIYICTKVWYHFAKGFSTEKKCHFDTYIYVQKEVLGSCSDSMIIIHNITIFLELNSRCTFND